MAYTPITVPRFGGLRLDADPSDLGLGGAASLNNVEFDPNGTVRTRPGYDQKDANTQAAPVWLVRYREYDRYAQVGVNSGIGATSLRVYNSSFTSIDTEPNLLDVTHAIESDSNLFIAAGTGFFVYSGASSSIILGTAMTTKFLAVQWPDNRVVAAGCGQAGVVLPDRVHFSAPALFTTFNADDFVDITPGDGQEIRMAVNWRELLFVFKETKFAVFYGNSTDATGGTIFNYRMVDNGVGCGYDLAACAAQDGVYFVHPDGVYRTTGGTPELVSGPIQPFFDGRTNGVFSPTGPLTSPRIHAGDDRLYVWQKGATGMFVMDLRTREWTYWVLSIAPYTLLPLADPREFLFSSSTGELYKFSPDDADDDGTDFQAHYQTGFQSVAEGKTATIRRFELTGTGELTHRVVSDHAPGAQWTTGTGSVAVTMGTSPAVEREYALQSGRCRDIGFRFSSVTGAWAVARWSALISAVRSY